MNIPLHMNPRRFLLLAILVFGTALIVWMVRRHRRLVRADLQNRGLVPGKRRRRSKAEQKRFPTLADVGTGLPPVRQTPPPGPTDGK